MGGAPAISQGLLAMGRAALPPNMGGAPGAPAPGSAPYPVSSAAEDALPNNWPHMLNGMIPSLAHALRRQAGGMPDFAAAGRPANGAPGAPPASNAPPGVPPHLGNIG